MTIDEYRIRINQQLGKLQTARENVRAERVELDRLDEKVSSLSEATTIAQAVAEKLQSEAHKRIARIVTECLSIFDEPYEFRIVFSRARGRTEARLVFERDGIEVDPMDGSGGGVVDVAAFALRLACLVLRRPQLRRLLVLDEPFKHVAAEYRPRVRAILDRLAKDLEVQVVMVTHDPQLRTGTTITIK